MTNQNVVPFAQEGAMMNPADLATALANTASDAAKGGAGTLLRLLKEGLWVYGQQQDEVEEGSEWAINPYSFEHGLIAWHDNKIEHERMVPVTMPRPIESDMPAATKGYDEQLAFKAMCITGADTGLEVSYRVTTVGGTKAIGDLAARIAKQAAAGAKELVPVVLLDMDSYKHKEYGKIYTPIFKPVRWISIDATPTPAAQRAAEDVAAPEVDDVADEPAAETTAAPRRRRRSQ